MAKNEKEQQKSIEDLSQLWAVLTAEQRDILRENYTVKKFKKNEIIYQEGDYPMYLMYLVEGQVKIFREGVGGRAQIVRIITPVGCFGYRAYLADEQYVTSAVAIEPSTLFFVPLTIFESFLKSNSEFAMFYLKSLAVDLGIADFRVVNLAQKHLHARLAESILFLRDSYGYEADGATIAVSLSREDMAGLSNMTTANAIRTLAQLANDGAVEVERRKIKIVDEEKLARISKFG
ncbi:MAG: Crp/Fnr family transcriptional regulator [Paludibacteraceae bacterium]|nr:Crp/Fnr family transcriptional regulator [Paludibacteraceae bacterium]